MCEIHKLQQVYFGILSVLRRTIITSDLILLEEVCKKKILHHFSMFITLTEVRHKAKHTTEKLLNFKSSM